MKPAFLLFLLLAALLAPHAGGAMTAKFVGDQMILEGGVLEGDGRKIKSLLEEHPAVRLVILRNSPGGDVPSGYAAGELFRARGLPTAVSGFCWSSCSRMFLGGKERRFTDDYPIAATEVGFHGHYDRGGRVELFEVYERDLKGWIIKHSDGKADPALVDRWIRIPINKGMAHFYHPTLAATRGVSTFLCQGDEPAATRILGCEKIAKGALEMGIATDSAFIHSADQAELRKSLPAFPAKSGFAEVAQIERLPLDSQSGLAEYKRFLDSSPPRAFAIAPGKSVWAWNAGTAQSYGQALTRCAERAKGPCQLYAVDDTVVWAQTR